MHSWLLTPAEWEVLLVSLRVSLLSVAVMFIPGIGCAWLLARRRFPGKTILDIAVHLPLVLPPVVVGYVLLLSLGRNGWVGRPLQEYLGIELAFTWEGAALASGVMGFPLLVRAARLSISAVDPRIEQAAATLGAGPWRIFFTVTLPLALPGVIAGLVLAFARSIGEFGATITFAGNIAGQTRTLPVAIFTAYAVPGGDAAAIRLICISVAISVLALVAAEACAGAQPNGGARRVLTVAFQHRRGPFDLNVEFQTDAPITGVFGPSGAGKTTLLHLIAGLDRPRPPHSGLVRLHDRTLLDTAHAIDLRPDRRRIGVVFQERRLFPHYSVAGNLDYGWSLLPPGERRLQRTEVVELLELGPLLNRAVRDLSGGERQRVSLARSLLASPRLLLLDEPLVSLDVALKEQILPYLRRIRDSAGVPMLYVSHDLTEILRLTDRVLLIDHGRVAGHGALLNLVHDPQASAVLLDAGVVNVLSLPVRSDEATTGIALLALPARAGASTGAVLRVALTDLPRGAARNHARVEVAIRPEDIALAAESVHAVSIQNQLPSIVTRLSTHADRLLVEVDVGAPLLAQISRRSGEMLGLRIGSPVFCLIKALAIRLLHG